MSIGIVTAERSTRRFVPVASEMLIYLSSGDPSLAILLPGPETEHETQNIPAAVLYVFRRFAPVPEISNIAGTAALTICESLLLALNDRNILPEREILGILRDAAAAHANDAGHDGKAELHTAVAELINGILDGGNSVRRR